MGISYSRDATDDTKIVDYAFEKMWKQMGEPAMLLMDLRPMMYPVILITDLRLAEEITKASSFMPYSAPKSPTVKDVHHLLGDQSIIAVQVRKDTSPLSPHRIFSIETWHNTGRRVEEFAEDLQSKCVSQMV